MEMLDRDTSLNKAPASESGDSRRTQRTDIRSRALILSSWDSWEPPLPELPTPCAQTFECLRQRRVFCVKLRCSLQPWWPSTTGSAGRRWFKVLRCSRASTLQSPARQTGSSSTGGPLKCSTDMSAARWFCCGEGW